MTIRYTRTLDGYDADVFSGFFEGWPDPPDSSTHLCILESSDAFVLAIDESADRPVGFITAITDGVLAAYIPLLEVLPTWRGQGIGSRLVEEICDEFDDLYMVDAVCDEDVAEFYKELGFNRQVGMAKRNYEHQSGS